MNVPPQAGGVVRKDVTHIQLESSQVPGLESPARAHTITSPQPAHPITAPQPAHIQAVTAPHPAHPQAIIAPQRPQAHTITAPQPAHPQAVIAPQQSQAHTITAPQQTNTPLTAKEQWLRDLAEQVREKKERQNKQSTTKEATREVYFPFGRPGCGAPIRTESGQVIADLRSKVRSSYEGPIQQAPSKLERAVSPPVGEYFPYGRPGCGAPNNTASHGVSYQSYGGDVPTSQHAGHQAGSYPTLQPTQFQQPYSTPSYQPAAPSHPPLPVDHTPSHPRHPYTEEYYPFGRPGGGAPVNTYTAHPHPPLPSHPPTQAVAQNTVTNPPQVQDTSIVSPREGFGRGAGPYVDKFVLQDMDQRRRKELDYRVSVSRVHIGMSVHKEWRFMWYLLSHVPYTTLTG